MRTVSFTSLGIILTSCLKVFKVLWSEPVGGKSAVGSDCKIEEDFIPAKYPGEKAYHSVRRFVIVKERSGHSLCV